MASKTRWGLVIDLERCILCHGCSVGCKVHNVLPRQMWWNEVITVDSSGSFPHAGVYGLPRSCMHCRNAPCVAVCPTNASQRREDGIVIIDEEKCVGCKYCMVACPYGARSFNQDKGVVQKCNLCLSRLSEGRLPVCVESCIGGARVFGNLEDPASEAYMLIHTRHAVCLHPQLGTEPAVFYCLPGIGKMGGNRLVRTA